MTKRKLTSTITTLRVNAGAAARAWLNAFLAASGDKNRKILYRTLSIEFFGNGVQFIGCSGTLLFRTWAPREPDEDERDREDWKTPPMPEIEQTPDYGDLSVVVLDDDKFALAFMKTLMAAASSDQAAATMTIGIETIDTFQFALSDDLAEHVVALQAFGQQLHCKVLDAPYVNWRGLDLGIARRELVDGMTISPDTFKTIGQLKGVSAVDLDFKGKTKGIVLHASGLSEVRGLAMPMRRAVEPAKEEP